MRRFDKIKLIHKANLLTEERYLSTKGVIKEGNLEWYSENLTNLLKSGKYYTDYETDGNLVIYLAVAIDDVNKLIYRLYTQQKVSIDGYHKGDGTTGPGMGDLGEFTYEDVVKGIEVEVFKYISGDYSDYEDVSHVLPREPMLTFNYNDEGVFYSIFDNEGIEDKIRNSEGLN